MSKINLLISDFLMYVDNHFEAGGINQEWLIYHPSSLLLADKIFFTPQTQYFLDNKMRNNPLDKSYKKACNILEEQNVIEVKKDKKIYENKKVQRFFNEINDTIIIESTPDKNSFKKDNPNKMPDGIKVENEFFCSNMIFSLYSLINASKKWNSKCLFTERETILLKYETENNFIIKGKNDINNNKKELLSKSFQELFNFEMPEYSIFEPCVNCSKLDCEYDYLINIEDNINDILNLRDDNDNFREYKNVFKKVNDNLYSKNYNVSSQEIINKFDEIKQNTNLNFDERFKKVDKWTNYSLLLLPAFIGLKLFIGDSLISNSLIAMDFSKAIYDQFVNYQRNKQQWAKFKFSEHLTN